MDRGGGALPLSAGVKAGDAEVGEKARWLRRKKRYPGRLDLRVYAPYP